MKKLIAVVSCLAVLSLFGKGEEFSVKATLEKPQEVYAPGDSIAISIAPRCPPGYSAHAWRLVGYVKDLPQDFAGKMNLPVVDRNTQWESVRLTSWNWKSPSLREVLKTTAAWPEGDYRVTILVLFRQDARPDTKTDVYKGAPIIFTLER